MTLLATADKLDPLLWKDKKHQVYLFNFGGPSSKQEVEPFLRKLFEDPFIIRAPLGSPLRKWIAKKIAKKRAPQSIEEYSSIGFSKINEMTQVQAKLLELELKKFQPETQVTVVNRYTEPFSESIVAQDDLQDKRVFYLSLYPHLSHTTTVSAYCKFDEAFRGKWGHLNFTSTRIFSWWHQKAYLNYTTADLASAAEKILGKNPRENLTVLVSAHGLPESYYLKGDPYIDEIKAHFQELRVRVTSLLKTKGLQCDKSIVSWHLSFQSRVGPVKWVKPYTDELVTELGKKNKGHLLIFPISFTSDHIETLYEMDVTVKEKALNSGFKSYQRVSAPNNDPKLAQCLGEILRSSGF